MNRIINKLLKKFRNDGANAVLIAVDGMVARGRRLFFRLVFGWDIRAVGAASYIRGSRHVSMGTGFSCRSQLWIEAVVEHNGVEYAPRIVIGENFSGGDSLHIAATSCVQIGNNVLVGSKVLITDHLHGAYSGAQQSVPGSAPNLRCLSVGRRVVIEDNVFIGDNVCILPDVTVGVGAIIASNSVVTKDVAAGTIVAGNPAVPIKRFCAAQQQWIKIE